MQGNVTNRRPTVHPTTTLHQSAHLRAGVSTPRTWYKMLLKPMRRYYPCLYILSARSASTATFALNSRLNRRRPVIASHLIRWNTPEQPIRFSATTSVSPEHDPPKTREDHDRPNCNYREEYDRCRQCSKLVLFAPLQPFTGATFETLPISPFEQLTLRVQQPTTQEETSLQFSPLPVVFEQQTDPRSELVHPFLLFWGRISLDCHAPQYRLIMTVERVQ